MQTLASEYNEQLVNLLREYRTGKIDDYTCMRDALRIQKQYYKEIGEPMSYYMAEYRKKHILAYLRGIRVKPELTKQERLDITAKRVHDARSD